MIFFPIYSSVENHFFFLKYFIYLFIYYLKKYKVKVSYLIKSIKNMSVESKSIFSIPQNSAENADEAKLAAFGYKQEFSRNYGFFSAFSFAFAISGLLGTISVTIVYPIWSGGPAGMVWCWFVGAFGCLSIGLSVAEITSCFPTSGGMYYVISHLVPEKYVPILCWINGWMYLIGAITGPAAADFGAASILLECISLRSNFTYVPSNGHVTAVTILILISQAAINSIPSKYLASITKYYCVINIVTTIALIVTILVQCPDINSRGYTFGTVINSTGWSADGWAFLFGFLQVSWVMTCYDATSRMSEETYNAAYYIPLAISSALICNALFGWVLIIVLVLCMGPNVDDILNSPTGQPLVAIFDYAMGPTSTTAYVSLTFVILWFSGSAAFCYISRSLWSFSRDGLFPFSKIWYNIDKRTDQPLRCVWLLCFIDSCLVLINLGSEIAMNAIFSANAICTDWSYVMVIGMFLFNKEKMGVQSGPFNLGKFSKPLMAYSCIWTLFVSIVFIFPNYMPVNKENMNYTVVIIGFCFIFSGLWYAIDARKWYKGPTGNLDDDNKTTDSATSELEGIEETSKVDAEVLETKEKPYSRVTVNHI